MVSKIIGIKNGQSYPAIIVFVKNAGNVTSAELKLILHGWLKVEVDAVDVVGTLGVVVLWRRSSRSDTSSWWAFWLGNKRNG